MVRGGLQRWLSARWAEARDLSVGPLEVNETGGYSNETVFFDVGFTGSQGPQEASLVARLAPFGGGLFPEYDLATQWRIQEAVGAHGIPAARQIGFEGDDSVVGSPFLVMERVPGRLATDHPLYCTAGWLWEAAPATQRTACQGAIEAMAAVHRLDWNGLGLSSVAREGGPGLAAEVAWWGNYLQWASEGNPARALAEALDWCVANQPSDEPPPALIWGDARLANMIFGPDNRPAALVDWEMASIGPPEVDLGWFTATRTQTRVLAGGLPDPELPGFLDHQETVRHYEQALGRPVTHLEWYEVFAMLRWGVCIASIHRILRRRGITEHFIFDSPLLPEWTVEMMQG